ncbi:MAG: hypothetical protein HYX80_07780 [Chloroflexi bacterium]|nr:hypothetical protein [Chloroflexota bacterium]
MITTVTTVTTITTVAAIGLGAAVSITAVIALVAFLATRELASASNNGFLLRVARLTSIGIIPLIITFAVIVAVKLAELL